MNGVCVIFRGVLDLNRLDGVASLEFDSERAEVNIIIICMLWTYIESIMTFQISDFQNAAVGSIMLGCASTFIF